MYKKRITIKCKFMLNIYQESISGALNIIKNIQILFVNIKCLIIYEKL